MIYIVEYELPDVAVITIGREGFECTEVVFNYKFVGMGTEGIHS